MCTVTIIPVAPAHSFRMVCNRDEQRTRPAAIPPTVTTLGPRTILMPRDAHAGGTWVALSDQRIALTLLNVNPPHPLSPPFSARKSRGSIIPALLPLDDHHDMLRAALALDARLFPPFRLVIASALGISELVSDGSLITLRVTTPIDRPAMFTSSGLGDHLVDSPRRKLFDESLGSSQTPNPRDQDAFHEHCWPDRQQLSVLMHRADARTVSRTVVTVGEHAGSMTYIALPDAAEPTDRRITSSVTLDLPWRAPQPQPSRGPGGS
jgi:hypothetical protein